MIVRIWTTEIDESREDEYRRFEQDHSVPMFRQQQGFVGVVFLRRAGGAAAVTLWRSREDADRLPESTSYRETVQRLESTGLLRGAQAVELLELSSAYMEA
jgi:heme-degrading monooxygenase HmoA